MKPTSITLYHFRITDFTITERICSDLFFENTVLLRYESLNRWDHLNSNGELVNIDIKLVVHDRISTEIPEYIYIFWDNGFPIPTHPMTLPRTKQTCRVLRQLCWRRNVHARRLSKEMVKCNKKRQKQIILFMYVLLKW